MSLEYTSNLIHSPSVLIVKRFGNKYKAIWCKSVRKKGFEKLVSDIEFEINPFDGSVSEIVSEFPIQREKLSNNISRAKSKIYEYAYCNDWDYFITLTISADKYNRYDLQTYIKDLGKWISNYSTHHGSKMFYVLVPEQHKDGAWHMHGLVSGILPKHLVVNEHGYLDFPMYSKKFGFCSLDPIKNHEAVSKYLTKYITKDLCSALYGQRCYYCSKGLQTAEVLYRFDNIDSECIEWDFEHPDGYCKLAMFDSLDFMQDICIM